MIIHMLHYVSNVKTVSPMTTLACLAPVHSMPTSLSALVCLSGPVIISCIQSWTSEDSLASARMNSILLNGSPCFPPCLGGPPTLKNPLRLLPTFHTVNLPSSNEMVSSRRPSGEKLTDDTALLCGSSTYTRDAVLRSYLKAF